MNKESYELSKKAGLTTVMIAGLSDDEFNSVKALSDFSFPSENNSTVAFENPLLATVVVGEKNEPSIQVTLKNNEMLTFEATKGITLAFDTVESTTKAYYPMIKLKNQTSIPMETIASSRLEYVDNNNNTVSFNDVVITLTKKDGTGVFLCGINDQYALNAISIVSSSMKLASSIEMA